MRAKILNASAGSGKTYQLAYKYVRDVIGQPGLYRHILAVTFTNKATEEMKSRILKEIHALASGAASPYLENLCRELSLDERSVRKRAAEVRSKILHDYSRFTVLTIDTFFQAHPARLYQGAGHRPQLQRRDRNGVGAVEKRRHAHRADHR